MRIRVRYVLWCHLSDSTHTGVLSEGECEYKVPNTYRIMDTNAVNTCVATTGIRVPESWLATGTRGRATGSAHVYS